MGQGSSFGGYGLETTNSFLGFKMKYKFGQGAFSTVYLGEQGGKMAGIKVIEIPNPTTSRNMTPEMLLGKEFQLSLRETSSQLNNILKTLVSMKDKKGVLRYYDYNISLDQATGVYKLAILTEYLDSFPVHAQKNDLTVRRILKMATDLCEGLEAMLQKGIAHGNIKENNIFYDPIKGFKLGDYFLNDILINTLRPRETYSDYGYRFLAPEAYSAEEYSYKTDIFSLAMLIYKLLNNGMLPYADESASKKVIREQFIESKTLPLSDNVPMPVYDVLKKATAFNLSDRYGSFAQMRDEMKEAVRNLDFEVLEREVHIIQKAGNEAAAPVPEELAAKEEVTSSFEIVVQEDKPKNRQEYVPGPNERRLIEEELDSNYHRPSSKHGKVPESENNEHAYYDEDEEDTTRNWISTIAFVLMLIFIGVAIFLIMPSLQELFK